jgi:MAP/microtubule affinity-regulating kinase
MEIYEEDIPFLKHEEVLYVSKGEDFNVNTYYSEYEIIKYLGQGGFGKVVLGRHKKTKELVAIKIIQVGFISIQPPTQIKSIVFFKRQGH